MVDTDKLRTALSQYRFYSKPSNGDSSAACTIGDMEKVINNTADSLELLIAELDKG